MIECAWIFQEEQTNVEACLYTIKIKRHFWEDADICTCDSALCIHIMHTCMHKWYYKSLYIYSLWSTYRLADKYTNHQSQHCFMFCEILRFIYIIYLTHQAQLLVPPGVEQLLSATHLGGPKSLGPCLAVSISRCRENDAGRIRWWRKPWFGWINHFLVGGFNPSEKY